jgi:aryl-phospho-beta-D-glucosidase BglC (GH1 family)
MRHKGTIALLALAIILGMVIAAARTVSAQTTGFLSVKGTWIVDSSGNPILLRGVNYLGYQCGRAVSHSESAYASFAQMGFNVVRLPISWANIEHIKDYFDITWLIWYVDQDVQWARKYGIYIVLDMHQYNWASRFGGCGAPDWSVAQYPPTEQGMREAVSDFWTDISLQAHLVMVWGKIASHYANEPTIAGYDLLNEPWVYSSVIPSLNASHLDSFYTRVTAAIRAVDQNHILFLEPANMNTLNTSFDNKIVWSPHFYQLSFASKYYPQNLTVLQADLAAKYQTFDLGSKTPMWIGEFGAFMTDGSADNWLKDAKALFDKYQIGWAWWAYPNPSDEYSIPDPVPIPEFSGLAVDVFSALAASIYLARRRRQ